MQTIQSKFQVNFAPGYAGQEVSVSLDKQGRLIITPIEQVRAVLKETFGMWADRSDIPIDGTEYVDQIRRRRRLDDPRLRTLFLRKSRAVQLNNAKVGCFNSSRSARRVVFQAGKQILDILLLT